MDYLISGTTGVIKNLVQSSSGNPVDAVKDFAKLAILGTTVETARRLASSGWNQFIESFFLTAHFTQDDYPYDWLIHWLSKQPAWSRSREFEITTRTGLRLGIMNSNKSEVEEEDEEEEDKALISGGRAKKVSFLPSHNTTHTIFYAGHWLHITRGRTQGTSDWYANAETLKISVIARNNEVIKQLVLQAKKEYERDAEHRVHIFLADIYGRWGWNGARQKRPLSSIVLERGIKEMLLEDAKDFLRSEDWYADRGIPFRRGYLLHGVPGSGKTSLIHALAGELGLDIYVVTLSSKGMNDSSLASLMGRVPSRCIVLLEDLDAAFTRSTSRDGSATGSPDTTTTKQATDDGNTLSLSGLLNSLDGVAATEGRLLFATTNHIDRLDPALSRPGRMDVWVDFKNATRWQAEELYKNFFPYEGKKLEDGSTATVETLSLMPPIKRRKTKTVMPLLTEAEMIELAKKFADRVPEGEMSVAALQGYLLKNKTRPREAIDELEAWVKTERETKAKLKKEKDEKEAKEKAEKDKAEKEEKDKLAATEKAAAKEKRKLQRAKEKRRAARRVAGEVPTDSSDSEYDKAPSPVPVPAPVAASTESASTPAEKTDASADKLAEGSDAHAEALVAALVDAATTKSSVKEAPADFTSGTSSPVIVDKPVNDEETEKNPEVKDAATTSTEAAPESKPETTADEATTSSS